MYLFWNIISKKEGSIIMIIERKEYLEKLIAWKDKQLIKIVTGVRRCGKSMLLEIYRNYLKEHGIEEEQIISINFEDLDYEELTDYRKLYKYLRELRPLQAIRDHYPKIILTMDEEPEEQYEGIRRINARDWLLGIVD